MLTGIALAVSEMPLALIERHRLRRHERGGEQELRFLYRDRQPTLPVWHGGQLRLAPWGCRRGESRVLPCTGWTRRITVEAGRWAGWDAEAVDVPATVALDNGVWYAIRQGVRGVLVHDERGVPRVYVVCEPASHYYRVMTRSDWMPLLIGERI